MVADPVASVRDFVEAGGDVLWLLFATSFAMWAMILERYWYLRAVFPRDSQRALGEWEARADQRSWRARKIRALLISELDRSLRRSLPLIRSLIAICPMLGLLGTVLGMIEVFEVMAVAGDGNVRAMAAGVSKATIPTMAGMVAALSGLYFSASLERRARTECERVGDRLLHP